MEYLTNYWAVSLHFCCNDIYLSKEHHWCKNFQNWCSRWWDVADWHWKVGFTPQAIRRACRSLQFLRSAPNDSPRHECLVTPERKNCKLRHAYSIHIPKTPSLGALVDHLWYHMHLSHNGECLKVQVLFSPSDDHSSNITHVPDVSTSHRQMHSAGLTSTF